mmetsp:Transcript_32553/g.24053  ORF Transcript_32553/g.24053 Transcript_32553/m.24053 type:complete len:99 (-) Transcript_32553:189-485(-)
MHDQNVNTPMFCSLQKLDFQDELTGQQLWNTENYVKSVRQKNAPMHWLGYLYKKIHQNENEYLVKLEIQGQPYKEQNMANMKFFLPKRIIKEAQEIKN